MKTLTEQSPKALEIISIANRSPAYRAALCAFILAINGEDTKVENILDEIEAEAVAEAYKRSVAVCADMNDPRMDKVLEILKEKVTA